MKFMLIMHTNPQIWDGVNRERALELAAMIPDARIDGLGIEVRPVVFTAGAARNGDVR
jgi:hypothetical protein